MKKRISDMMDNIQDDSVDIQIKDIASSQRIKEVTMSKLHPAAKTYTHKHRPHRVLLIAAAIAMALSAGALALWRLSLRDLEGPKEVFTDQGTLSLSSMQGTAQYAAAAEWEGHVQRWFDEGENMVQPGYVPDEYAMYNAFSQEAKDTLDALLAKYGLKMHGMPANPGTLDELYSAVGVSGFMPGPGGERPASCTLYVDGTFSCSSAAELLNARAVNYQLCAFGKEYFTRGAYMLADRLEEPEEWTYTTSSGVEVLLALGSGKSILAVDMDDCFIFVDIMSGRTNAAAGNDAAAAAYGAPALSKAALEAFAEGFDFKAINGLSA